MSSGSGDCFTGIHTQPTRKIITITSYTSSAIAYGRSGPRDHTPVVLLHAGVADRRMWDPIWPALTADHDVIRLDLRGFGDSTTRPSGALSHRSDVLDTLRELGVERCHLIGASMGAGVATEVALARPDVVSSLLLSAPGGSLIAELTPQLGEFIQAERAAMSRQDLDAATEANLDWWLVGPQRGAEDIDSSLRAAVRSMQRRAFEITADWDDVEESELDPPPFEQLSQITAPTTVLLGGLDLDAIRDTADRVSKQVPGARRVEWPDVAHLPSMERPDDFVALVRGMTG